MIKELADLLKDFPGAANQTCCFLHILLNLMVKSIIKQFNLPKAHWADRIINKATKELFALAGDIELEKVLKFNTNILRDFQIIYLH